MFGWLDLDPVTVMNGLAMGALLFSIASGLSLIYGQAGVLNLAHGTVVMVGAYLGYSIVGASGTTASFLAAAAVAAVVGAGAGIALAAATRPLASRGQLEQALLTLGVALVGAEVVRMVWGENVQSVPAPPPFDGSLTIMGSPFPSYRVFVILFGVAAALAMYVCFERTRFGSVVRAGVEDRQMLAAVGINPTLVIGSVFAVGGAVAALTGVVGAPVLGARPGLDGEVLLLSLIVVVIGGLGSVKGALVGALLIGQVQAVGVSLVPDAAPFVLFTVMGLMLILRPAGLFGAAVRRHA